MLQGIVGQKFYNIVEKSKNNLPHELSLTARQKKTNSRNAFENN